MQITANPFKRFGTKHVVSVFDDPMSAAKEIDALPGNEDVKRQVNNDGAFYSGTDWRGMMQGAIQGDEKTAALAERMMQKIASVSYATEKRQRVNSPFGRVSVGAYLASDPMPCRRKVKVRHDHAPLSVVVSLNSMADCKAGDLAARGVAVAAMVRRVSLTRPVALYLSRFSQAGAANSAMLIKFPTAPLDSHRLAFCLSNQAFCRGLGFAYHVAAKDVFSRVGLDAGHVSGAIMFAGGNSYSQSRHCPFSADLADFLRTDMFYIPGSDPANADYRAMTKDPVSWINETVAELTKAKLP